MNVYFDSFAGLLAAKVVWCKPGHSHCQVEITAKRRTSVYHHGERLIVHRTNIVPRDGVRRRRLGTTLTKSLTDKEFAGLDIGPQYAL